MAKIRGINPLAQSCLSAVTCFNITKTSLSLDLLVELNLHRRFSTTLNSKYHRIGKPIGLTDSDIEDCFNSADMEWGNIDMLLQVVPKQDSPGFDRCQSNFSTLWDQIVVRSLQECSVLPCQNTGELETDAFNEFSVCLNNLTQQFASKRSEFLTINGNPYPMRENKWKSLADIAMMYTFIENTDSCTSFEVALVYLWVSHNKLLNVPAKTWNAFLAACVHSLKRKSVIGGAASAPIANEQQILSRKLNSFLQTMNEIAGNSVDMNTKASPELEASLSEEKSLITVSTSILDSFTLMLKPLLLESFGPQQFPDVDKGLINQLLNILSASQEFKLACR